MQTRPLTLDDDDAARILSSTAYGYSPGPPRTEMPAGRTTWGAFDGDTLVGIATDVEQQQWFGGSPVPAGGIAGVAVAAEHRGRGIARLVVEAAAQGARDRGAVVSSLYPTAPALYRSLGWEHVGALTWWDLPTAALRGIPAPLEVRAATDLTVVRDLYDARSRAGNGALARPVPSAGDFQGITVCDGGYVTWDRGGGYRDDGWLDVWDLVAETAEARQTLLSFLGTFAMVAPHTRIRLQESDPLHWQLPVEVLRQRSRQPWMLRLLDPAAALSHRGWSDVDVSGLTPRGLGVWWAGGVTTDALRSAGLGEAPAGVATGPRPELADYF